RGVPRSRRSPLLGSHSVLWVRDSLHLVFADPRSMVRSYSMGALLLGTGLFYRTLRMILLVSCVVVIQDYKLEPLMLFYDSHRLLHDWSVDMSGNWLLTVLLDSWMDLRYNSRIVSMTRWRIQHDPW